MFKTKTASAYFSSKYKSKTSFWKIFKITILIITGIAAILAILEFVFNLI